MVSAVWTPDQPLRADASDEQIVQREQYLFCRPERKESLYELVAVAREFAKACVLGGRLRGRALITRELQAAPRAESEAKLAKTTGGFVAFIGCGDNTRGRFPVNLTELNADYEEWSHQAARTPATVTQ